MKCPNIYLKTVYAQYQVVFPAWFFIFTAMVELDCSEGGMTSILYYNSVSRDGFAFYFML